jgi:hypothetical protein
VTAIFQALVYAVNTVLYGVCKDPVSRDSLERLSDAWVTGLCGVLTSLNSIMAEMITSWMH